MFCCAELSLQLALRSVCQWPLSQRCTLPFKLIVTVFPPFWGFNGFELKLSSSLAELATTKSRYIKPNKKNDSFILFSELPRFTRPSLVAEEFDKWHLGEEEELKKRKEKKKFLLRNNNRPLCCSPSNNCQKRMVCCAELSLQLALRSVCQWPLSLTLAQLAESNFFVCSDNGEEGPRR
ncbi:hypothetical protein CDAR_314381 [Caerostris darwini]|uniref:Uncharacterized protein n=1 Tax=Caerostris darwini TaxID=1538125 RepID=A0AAV4TXJ5_9ARAC|nr:hypothetical protein CDAR_314381 [Caerostris darwini]